MSVGRAIAKIQKTVYVVVEQTITLKDLVHIDVVVFRCVFIRGYEAREHAKENYGDLDSSQKKRKEEEIKKKYIYIL